ncbi:anti-sigma factor [Mucilaginibacter arboris]|uniref:Regulator of SigK n=1 Tax=Mucilaginibacter arboris TaxID=2682090 RepID=A0A7K1SW93_9SPHI|nr:anti-sigma factor [Mucilaginibacter arboris]MVN21508.1 hypothetical protein [Mucilaginibacter arboris]
MEDIKQYIESGILELYILDTLNPEEKLEVESMAAKYPAIQKELDEISQAMELYAEQNAVEPSENLRETVLNQLIGTTQEPVSVPQKNISENKKVIPLQAAKQTYFYKYAFAASIALLLVSLAALFNMYNRLQESRQQLVTLQLQNQKFANQVNFQESQLNQYKQQSGGTALQKPVFVDSVTVKGKTNTPGLIAMQSELKQSKKRILALELQNKDHEKELNAFSDPDTRFIKLKGVKDSSSMLLAWNPEKKQLWINKKASTLPANDQQHQYQLWAIRKLKPISLGVFDVRKTDSIMEKMASIDKASAFAVTLEPRGGSEKPTMKQMMVMGFAHK